MSNPERPVELEMVAIGVPVTIRMRDAIEAYASAHPDTDGQAPSNAELLRKAIASVIRYDLVAESKERDRYSQRKTYATEAERIAAKKATAAEAKRIRDAAMDAWKLKSKEEQAAILRASLTK